MPSGKNNGMGKAWANLDQSEKWSTKGIGAILKVEDAIAYRHHKVFRALGKQLNNKCGEHPTTFPDWWCQINSIDDDVATCAKEELESIILNHDRVLLLVDSSFADVYIPLFRYPQMVERLCNREIRKMVERKRTSPFHTYKPTDELYNFPNNLVDNGNDELPNYSYDGSEKLFYIWRCVYPFNFYHLPNIHEPTTRHLKPINARHNWGGPLRKMVYGGLTFGKDQFGYLSCSAFSYIISPFCLYDLKQDASGGQFDMKKIRNCEYLEGYLSREKYTFGTLCMMLSQVGTEGQTHAMKKDQWKIMRAVKRAGHMKGPIGDLMDDLNGGCRRLRRGEWPYEDESDYESIDQDDSDSDSDSDDDYDFDGDSNVTMMITIPMVRVLMEITQSPCLGSELDNENEGGHNEDDEIQVDAE
ncbi:hypothetical protein V866_000194 [Kwoniella sp. B9012]